MFGEKPNVALKFIHKSKFIEENYFSAILFELMKRVQVLKILTEHWRKLFNSQWPSWKVYHEQQNQKYLAWGGYCLFCNIIKFVVHDPFNPLSNILRPSELNFYIFGCDAISYIRNSTPVQVCCYLAAQTPMITHGVADSRLATWFPPGIRDVLSISLLPMRKDSMASPY